MASSGKSTNSGRSAAGLLKRIAVSVPFALISAVSAQSIPPGQTPGSAADIPEFKTASAERTYVTTDAAGLTVGLDRKTGLLIFGSISRFGNAVTSQWNTDEPAETVHGA